MKKETKKKKKFKLKTKWKTWMTITSVIAGVFLISGSVVLGVFLSGGFNEKTIYQEGFPNQYTLSDEKLLNTQTNQIEVKENFQITLPLTDNEVTKKSVAVSFVGSAGKPDGLEDGWVGNGSIAVPEEVTLGVPFEVKLLSKTYQDEKGEDFTTYAGGISTIRFAYEDLSQSTFDMVIAVDIPVYKTVTYLANDRGEKLVDEGGKPVSTIIKDEEFHVMTEFYPKDSEYLYSDNKRDIAETERRKKMSFYEYEGERELITTNYATTEENKDKISFTAGDRMAKDVKIKGYTFKNAKDQLAFLESASTITDPETYYRDALGYFSNLGGEFAGSELSLIIDEASVDHFDVGSDGSQIEVDAGIAFDLYVHGDEDHKPNLKTNVYSTASDSVVGDKLDNLLKDIVVRFEVGDVNPVKSGSLVIADACEKITIDDVDYYRPVVPSKNYKFAYWTLKPMEAQTTIDIYIYLLKNDRTELFKSATGEPQVKHVTLKVNEHEEAAISWINEEENITVLLNHDSNGEVISKTINLSEYVINPSTNLYRDAVYFAYFGEGEEAALKEKANAVIGENGYIEKYSGQYSTQSGDIYLFAINGSNLTLFQTCEFNLYYGIQIGEAENGRYEIYVMCSKSKVVVCEEALYDDSVKQGGIDTELFPPNANDEVSINQGSTSTVSVYFTITAESLPVFKNEFQKGYLSLIIKDDQGQEGQDITNLFVIDGGTLTNIEDNMGRLEYKISVHPSIQISERNGIRLASFELVYNNESDDPIIWRFYIEDEKIVIYSPEASEITIQGNDLLDMVGNGVNVSQILNSSGKFETKLQVGGQTFNAIEDFIKAIVGEDGAGITITDQKENTETLAGQWRFAILTDNSEVITISDNGKSFSFKSTDSATATLYIRSTDGKADLAYKGKLLQIVFNVTSQGITKLQYDVETKTYQIELGTETTSIARVDLQKYGAKSSGGESIDLKQLIKFYTTDEGGNSKEYEGQNYSFRFNTQYYSEAMLEDDVLLSLFGEDGMLTIYNNDIAEDFDSSYTATNIRLTLQSLTNITKIVIRKNFYTDHRLEFVISDEVGAVNTVFNLTLLSNFFVGNENYPDRDGEVEDQVIYAGKENKFKLRNEYEDHNQGTKDNFYSLFNAETYYILNQNGSYELVRGDSQPANAIGEFTPNDSDKQILFYDFWEAQTRTYTVYFRPEGNNRFALNLPITFIVERDINIADQNQTFYVLSTDQLAIDAFVKVTRHDVNKPIESVEFIYEFSDYLEFDNLGHVVQNSQVIIFDYNQKRIETKLTISYEANGVKTKLQEIPINIELYKSGSQDIYTLIASKLRKQRTEGEMSADKIMPTAQVQSFGEGDDQIDYMVVDTSRGEYWQFFDEINNHDDGIESWKINPVQSKKEGGTFIRNNVYTNNSGVITFKEKADLTYGLLNQDVLLSIRFDENGINGNRELAWMYIPLIISGVGYNNVIYDNLEDETRTLESALSTPEALIEKGVYNEIKAGQVTKILTSYTNSEQAPTQPGLYYLEGQTPSLRKYSIATNVTENYSSLIKTIGNPTGEGTLLLNHLATSVTDDVFIALEYRLQKPMRGSYSNTLILYYLMKVVPDLKIEDPLYAYNGDTEYITGKLNENNEISLEKPFEPTTLNSGLKRFMYSKDIALKSQEKSSLQVLLKSSQDAILRLSTTFSTGGDKQEEVSKIIELKYDKDNPSTPHEVDISKEFYPYTIADGQIVNVSIIQGDVDISYDGLLELSTLKAENKVVSVQLSTMESPYLSPEQWREAVAISFSEDYSNMTIRPIKDVTMTIVISHSYVGGPDGQLSVVGGDRTFTFVLNEKQQTYGVRFKDGDETSQTDRFVKDVRNGKDKEIELTVDLLSVSGGSGSNSGTIVPGVLQIECTSGAENLNRDEGNGGKAKGFEYDNTTGAMTIYLKDYIEEDKQVIFTLFTQQGYLAEIVLNLQANVKYHAQSVKKSDIENGIGKTVVTPELMAGLSYDLTKLISLEKVTEENDSEYSDNAADESSLYTITAEILADGNDKTTKDFVSFNGAHTLTIKNLLTDGSFRVDYTITFTGGFEDAGNQLKFSQTYHVLKSISTPEAYTEPVQVIAGKSHDIKTEELSEVIKNGDYATANKFTADDLDITTSTSDPAFEKLENNTIYTNYISESTTLTLKLNIGVKLDGTVKQTYSVNYAISIAPSVKLGVTYPDPSKPQTTSDNPNDFHSNTEMSYEILEANTEYATNGDYSSSGTEFESIIAFLTSPPTFAYNSKSTRLNIYNARDPEEMEVTYEERYLSKKDLQTALGNPSSDLRVTVARLENAQVIVNNTTSLATSSTIEQGKAVTFKAGNAVGIPSIIVLNITYNNVSTSYTIRLQSEMIKLERVLPTGNTLSGEKPNAGATETDKTITYEKIYLDKTSTEDLFAEGRIFHAEMADDLQGYVDDYYFVFTDNTHFYASYPIYIKSDMTSKTIDFDLGIGTSGKTFVGAYLTSTFENAKIKILDGTDYKRKLFVREENASGDTALSALSGLGEPVELFKTTLGANNKQEPKVYTTSRIQLQYGVDENNVPIRVNYSRYSDLFKTNGNMTFNVSDKLDAITEGTDILKTDASLSLDNGQNTPEIKTLTYNYYYMLSIDVDVKEKATNALNYIQVEVSKTYSSIVELLGITHPVSGKPVTASDFTTTGTGLYFKTLYFDSTTVRNDYGMTQAEYDTIQKYLTSSELNIGKFRKYVNQSGITDESAEIGEDIYLYSAATQNVNKNIYDYEIIPYGAKNAGDFVLTQIQYQIDSTHKTTFYAVIKIVPDYDVTYDGNSGNSTIENEGADNEAISNLDNPYRVDQTLSQKFQLTSDGNQGYVSVKHKNGSYTTTERSISSFTITMPLNQSVESITYNDASNLSAKIFFTGSKNFSNWKLTPDSDPNCYSYNKTNSNSEGANAPIIFENVQPVIFGNQYYMIEAKDDYGFIYKIYFVLVAAKETPTISNEITVVENGLLDFGSTYQLLSISTSVDTDNSKLNCSINSTMETPTQNGDVSLLVFNGITAWQFDKDYINEAIKIDGSSDGGTLLARGDSGWGYKASTEKFDKKYDISFSEQDIKYFDAPDIEKIQIESVKLYTLDGQLINEDDANGGNLSTVGGATGTNQANWKGPYDVENKQYDTTTNADKPFATGAGYFYNEKTVIESGRHYLNPRNPYEKNQKNEKGESDPSHPTSNLWKIPRIQDANVYQNSNIADLRIVVRLRYTDGDINEICDVSAPISVMRESTLTQNPDRVVVDGVAFNVLDEDNFDPSEKTSQQKGMFNKTQSGFTINTVINDTLEVLAPAGETISFYIELQRSSTNNEVLAQKTQVRVPNSAYNYARTYYIPLSRYFNQNVDIGNKVIISDVSHPSTQFYYITNDDEGNVVKPNLQEGDPDTTQVQNIKMTDGQGEFTIQAITQDVAYIDNALMINNSSSSYSINKYYIIKGKYEDDATNTTFTYRQTANYIVTARVFELVPNADKGEIIFAMAPDNPGDGSTVSLKNWKSAFDLYNGTTESGGEIKKKNSSISFINEGEGKFDGLDYCLRFQIAEDVADSSHIGKAKIDENTGKIELLDNPFAADAYIKVVISVKISGTSRNITDDTMTTNRYKVLGILNLGLKKS